MNNMTPKRYNPFTFYSVITDSPMQHPMEEDEHGEYVHIDDYNILASRYAELLENTNTLALSGTALALSGTEDERELFTEDDVNEAFFGED